MKLLNWIFGVLLILLGIVAYDFSITPMLLLITAGVLGLPPLAILMDKKLKTNRSIRNIIVATLIFVALYIIGLGVQ